MAKTAGKRRTLTADMVGQSLRQRILREGLVPGARLPGYWELARELDVAYVTVKRGVDALVQDGVVERVHGKGLFVAKTKMRRPCELRSAMLIFPTSMHYVMTHAYATEQARGVLFGLEPEGHGFIRSMVSDGIIYGDHVDTLNPAAVIMMGVENDEYLQMAVNWGRPLVAVDYCSEAVPIDFVACDNRAAARRCVEHLAGLGHRRLAYLGGDEMNPIWMKGRREELLVQRPSDARERRQGVLAAAADLGLPEPRMIGDSVPATARSGPEGEKHSPSLSRALSGALSPERSGEDAHSTKLATKLATKISGGDPSATITNRQASLMESWENVFRSRSDRPTALVLDSEMDAPRVMRRLAELGLRVPEDVAICAVAGTGVQRDCPHLTLCKFDFYAMGQKAVEVLKAQMARPGKPVNRIHRIGFEWVEGSTCGARA